MEDEEEGLLLHLWSKLLVIFPFYKMSISPRKQATSTPLVDLKISKSHNR